jgi:molybdopterin molybdotransferase
MNRFAERPQRIARLTPLSAALAWIDGAVHPVPPHRVPVAAAGGLILAEPIVIPAARPHRPLAWRDGWGLRSDDTLDAGGYAPALLSQPPVRLDLGDELPPGVDAVAPLDGIDPAVQTALVVVAPGEGVLAVGSDARADETVKTAGARMGLTDIAALTALGIAEVGVRAPRLGLVAARTDAIVVAIVDFIAATVAAAGGSVERHTSIETCAQAVGLDAVLIVGGTGSGSRDASVRSVEHIGKIHIHGIGLSPGETAALGIIAQRPAVLVPGRVDAALAVWLTLGRRLMTRLCAGAPEALLRRATLTSKIASGLGFAELVLLRRDRDGVAPLATGHLPLATLAAADGFVIVGPDSEGFAAGATLDMDTLP